MKFTSGCYITTLITEWQDAWNGSETFLLKQVMISYLRNMTVSLMFVESKSWLSLTVSKISKLIERRYFWVSETESCIRAILNVWLFTNGNKFVLGYMKVFIWFYIFIFLTLISYKYLILQEQLKNIYLHVYSLHKSGNWLQGLNLNYMF